MDRKPASVKYPLMTIKQTAVELNVSDRTVRRLIDKGELRAYRVGGQLRISPQDVDVLLVESLKR